jgi:Bifunctional DNA primase/polymerase, N-terminal
MGATPTEIIAAALDYAKRGIPVFPVMPTEKKKPLTINGLYDATTDEKQIRAWWKQWPKAMIGAPTGEKSGFWVLDPDVDPKKNLNGSAELDKLLAIHGALPSTRGVITPRGRHYHFRMNGGDIRNSTSKVAPGIDVRGTGGYIVLPPSVRNNGAVYQWCGSIDDTLADAPDWLVELAREANSKTRTRQPRPQPQPSAKTNGGGSSRRDERWARKILEEECALIAAAPDGQRNDTLNARGYNLFSLVGGGYLDENEVRSRLWSAAEANGSVAEDANEVRNTIASASSGISNPRYRPQPGSNGSPPPTPPPSSGPQPGTGGSGAGAPPPSGPSGGTQPGPGPGPQPIPGVRRPTIQLIEGELPRVVDEAEAALIADIARQQLYQRGELVVRPVRLKLRAADMQGNKRETSAWQLIQITCPALIETFTRVAHFERWNERAKDWLTKNCPKWVAEIYLARTGRWKIPVLLKIINAPFLREDGSLCERPGYDPDSALLYLPGSQTFPSVPAIPTMQ